MKYKSICQSDYFQLDSLISIRTKQLVLGSTAFIFKKPLKNGKIYRRSKAKFLNCCKNLIHLHTFPSPMLHSKNSTETEYTDEVEIGAGWKTPFVYLWAKAFYSHRQKKWIKLLNKQFEEKVH